MRPIVLIVEDNSMLAIHLAEIVEQDLNAESIVTSKVSEALGAVTGLISLALLDIEILEGNSYPVARILIANHVPMIFVSGNDPETLPDDLKHVPFLAKPYVDSTLMTLAKSLCHQLG